MKQLFCFVLLSHPDTQTVGAVQDAQVLESLEGALGNVTDGIVAEAQGGQAAQLRQALRIQPREVVEGQNPEEGIRRQLSPLGHMGHTYFLFSFLNN